MVESQRHQINVHKKIVVVWSHALRACCRLYKVQGETVTAIATLQHSPIQNLSDGESAACELIDVRTG